MFDIVISVLGSANTMKKAYQNVAALFTGDKQKKLLEQVSQDMKLVVERLDDNLLWAAGLETVKDVTKSRQETIDDKREVRSFLSPLGRAMDQELLSSAVILTPERLKAAFQKNPWDFLEDVRPLAFTGDQAPMGKLPVMFESQGAFYVGWSKPLVLEMTFDCAVTPDPAAVGDAEVDAEADSGTVKSKKERTGLFSFRSADNRRARKAKWEERQKQMEADYHQAILFDDNPDLRTAEKIKIWELFLSEFAAENPFSDRGEPLRIEARKRLSERRAEAGWKEHEQAMKAAFQAAMETDEDNETDTGIKIAAWDDFLYTYHEKNPYSDTDVSLREIARKRRDERIERNEWDRRQSAMETAFREVMEMESDTGVSLADKIAAWNRFLAEHSAKNPYSDRDESLRTEAKRRLLHLNAQSDADAQKDQLDRLKQTIARTDGSIHRSLMGCTIASILAAAALWLEIRRFFPAVGVFFGCSFLLDRLVKNYWRNVLQNEFWKHAPREADRAEIRKFIRRRTWRDDEAREIVESVLDRMTQPGAGDR